MNRYKNKTQVNWIQVGLFGASLLGLAFSVGAVISGMAAGHKQPKTKPRKKKEPVYPYHDYTETAEKLDRVAYSH